MCTEFGDNIFVYLETLAVAPASTQPKWQRPNFIAEAPSNHLSSELLSAQPNTACISQGTPVQASFRAVSPGLRRKHLYLSGNDPFTTKKEVAPKPNKQAPLVTVPMHTAGFARVSLCISVKFIQTA